MRIIVSFLVLSSACKHNEPDASAISAAEKDATLEGIPLKIVKQKPAEIILEMIESVAHLAKASDPDGKPGSSTDLPFEIDCEPFAGGEDHCRLTYRGRELQLNLTQFFFNTLSGGVFARRGCLSRDCPVEPLRMWMKTRSYLSPQGKKNYEFKVCRIEGLEVGVNLKTPFRFLSKFYSAWTYKPDIHGFSAIVEEQSTSVPVYDANGDLKLTQNGKAVMEPGLGYKLIKAFAGIGPIGPFPSGDCSLHSEVALNLPIAKEAPQESWQLPEAWLTNAPGQLVKFASETLQGISSSASGETLKLNLRCLNHPDSPTCELTYKGPSLIIPIKEEMTGISSIDMSILRKCSSPGCQQKNEAQIKFRAVKSQATSIMEICSVKGIEVINAKKIPFESQIFGQPDLKGASLKVDTSVANKPTIKSINLGISYFGKFPNSNCDLI